MTGSHAHSFVVSFAGLNDLKSTTITDSSGKNREFVDLVVKNRQKLDKGMTNMGELAAFISYAQVKFEKVSLCELFNVDFWYIVVPSQIFGAD